MTVMDPDKFLFLVCWVEGGGYFIGVDRVVGWEDWGC